MTPDVALRLGRVSNLPTVWTNVLAATALAGHVPPGLVLLALCLSMSLVYVGGMYLNDAFDREHDARFRPERPIPSGQVRASTVFASGFALLGAGIALIVGIASRAPHGPLLATLSALGLGACVVFYDAHHKNNPLSPLIMSLCRVLVYVTTAFCVTPSPPALLWMGAGVLGVYLVLLTAIAKREVVRSLGMTVPHLIAGICVLDAALAAVAGRFDVALLCMLGWPATLVGQRYVSGT